MIHLFAIHLSSIFPVLRFFAIREAGMFLERVFSYSNRSGFSRGLCYGDLKGYINAEFDVPVYGQKEFKLKKDYLFVAGTCVPVLPN